VHIKKLHVRDGKFFYSRENYSVDQKMSTIDKFPRHYVIETRLILRDSIMQCLRHKRAPPYNSEARDTVDLCGVIKGSQRSRLSMHAVECFVSYAQFSSGAARICDV